MGGEISIFLTWESLREATLDGAFPCAAPPQKPSPQSVVHVRPFITITPEPVIQAEDRIAHFFLAPNTSKRLYLKDCGCGLASHKGPGEAGFMSWEALQQISPVYFQFSTTNDNVMMNPIHCNNTVCQGAQMGIDDHHFYDITDAWFGFVEILLYPLSKRKFLGEDPNSPIPYALSLYHSQLQNKIKKKEGSPNLHSGYHSGKLSETSTALSIPYRQHMDPIPNLGTFRIW
ncbi:hypothetical protein ACO22_01745 [Paracoccidioides brasiliensis]|uniref:Uncharacterized protein n=1 Tax=Paracoccidioides brasiliensis TaxID=121759 RepID=A0A1D2JKR0_PARBR|nr:hypothetical protein ACO22_01745 [Paracoccidioides brasiliensis]